MHDTASIFLSANDKDLHRWYDVRHFENLRHDPYIAMEFTEDSLQKRTLFNFTIGNDKRCEQKQMISQICNGPLEQGAYRYASLCLPSAMLLFNTNDTGSDYIQQLHHAST